MSRSWSCAARRSAPSWPMPWPGSTGPCRWRSRCGSVATPAPAMPFRRPTRARRIASWPAPPGRPRPMSTPPSPRPAGAGLARGAGGRAGVLLAAAAWMRERRLELAALEVRECAKPWPEADADVCEAIDFLEYYARGAIELDSGVALVQVPGERNEMRYTPRGVAAVVSPWNFPIAIPCGMTAAALATGNSVVFKPAEQSPGCGLRVVEALRAGGVPASALALLPGEGEV